MFLSGMERKSGQGGVIGLDISDAFAQISYWMPGTKKPETLSQVVGREEYMIPAVLCRKTDRDVWVYGKEAQKAAAQKEGILVEHLLSRALAEESVEVDGQTYEGAVLLALFVKRSLSLLGGSVNLERAAMLMLTLDRVDKSVLKLTGRLAMLLGLPEEKVSCMSRAESFFFYNINQPEELWRHQCMIFAFGPHCLKTLLFSVNRNTKPVTVTVQEQEWEEVAKPEGDCEQWNEEESGRLDEQFAALARKLCAGRIVDTIYLIGDVFDGNWYQSALSVLCAGRRVFRGNNLYSKGACYGGMAKCPSPSGQELEAARLAKEYVYLGSDMLKVNVGLEVMRQRESAYYALLDAGVNWYDARGECDFLLDADRSFSLRLVPLNARGVKEVIVTLDGVPERPPRTTRIHLIVTCTDAETIKLRMEDKGFGELFPASTKVWEETLRLGAGGRKEEKDG